MRTGIAATACYTYDAEGRRVRRALSGDGITDDYLYDLDGHFITQVSGQGTWVRGEIYAGETHIATYENDLTTPTTFFTHADHLGTERMQTAVNGSSCETITNLPFGDGMNETGSCDPTQLRFTGKMRDFETNLDNFGARYNSSSLGRFISPDPVFFQAEMLTDPQRLNEYAYARNNPLLYIDPSGKAIQLSSDSDEQQKQLSALCSASGLSSDQCSNYLYANPVTTADSQGNSVTNYYVGIYTNGANGQSTSYSQLNSATGALDTVINDKQVYGISIVPNGTSVQDAFGNSLKIGPFGDGATAGANGFLNGKPTIFLLDPSTNPGVLPQEVMSNNKPGTVNQGILLGHELGESWAEMHGDLHFQQAGVVLENKVRKAQDPTAPLRTKHDLSDKPMADPLKEPQ